MDKQRISRKLGLKGTKKIKKCNLARKKRHTRDESELIPSPTTPVLKLKIREEVSNKVQEDTKENMEMQKEAIMSEIPRALMQPSNHERKPGVIFILEKASLVLANVGRKYQILRSDIHADYLRRKKMNPYDYRPDIVHEALREIMNSELCRTGNVRAVFVKTVGGELIKVEPNCWIPGSMTKFCGMMTQCLQEFSIKAQGRKNVRLLRLVKNPVTQHLPVNSLKIGFSFSSKNSVTLQDYVCSMNGDMNFVFVVGTMAHGKIDSDYIDEFLSGCFLAFQHSSVAFRIGSKVSNSLVWFSLKGRVSSQGGELGLIWFALKSSFSVLADLRGCFD